MVVPADVPYQVGFASLERNLEVGGELASEVGEVRSVGGRWCRSSSWPEWVLLCCDPGRLSVASLPNPPFLPTVGWMSVAGWVVVVPTVMWPVDLDFFGLDLGWVVRATLVAPAAARSRTARRYPDRRRSSARSCHEGLPR